MSPPPPHFLVVALPMQGHINPSLQLAKRLVHHGAHVTFATSVYANRKMHPIPLLLHGLNFATFSDGFDDGVKPEDIGNNHLSETRRRGPETLKQLIASSMEEGRPVTCLVYAILVPWAAEVARDLNIPSALLWIQPATALNIYYYYFNGYGDVIGEAENGSSSSTSTLIKFPGMPLTFASQDLPSFILPMSPEKFSLVLSSFKEHLDELEKDPPRILLVNTFDALEPEALLAAIHKYNPVTIGPLLPSSVLDSKDPSDTSFGGDLFHGTKDHHYKSWLDSQPEGSVLYISFGSTAVLSKKQAEEVARALLETAKPFLWVIREGEDQEKEDLHMDELGIIVSWCSQVEVLSHPSLGCFMTHCGWNSSLESLVLGVPVVAFPQGSDQGTNAKLIEDALGTGVRVRTNGEGIVEADEIKRCLEFVMGNEQIRRNASKWKMLAREAAKEGGSSDTNLKAFIKDVSKICH